jgi:hypothetical protein
VGAIAQLADFFEHGVFVFATDIGFENDDHNIRSGRSTLGLKAKAAGDDDLRLGLKVAV